MSDQGLLEGKVAFVTGSSRGQGHVHVERFLKEGADVIAADLHEPSDEVEKYGRRLVRAQCDVRDSDALAAAVARGTEQLGPISVVVANAGINGVREQAWELGDDEWQNVIDINLSGVWRTIKAATPSVLEADGGGSIVIIGSTAAVKGYATTAHYASAKHGLVGLMKVLSAELAPRGVRVNMVHPTAVNTELIHSESMYRVFTSPGQEPTRENFESSLAGLHQLPINMIEPEDVTEAVLWFASDLSRFVTGAQLLVDGGATQ